MTEHSFTLVERDGDGRVVQMRRANPKPAKDYGYGDWTPDRFFRPPPGPEGYIVVALRWPSNDRRTYQEWLAYMVREGRMVLEEGTSVEDYPTPDWWTPWEWSHEHLSQYHGWTDIEIDRWVDTRGPCRHDAEHHVLDVAVNADARGEGDDIDDDDLPSMLIPHTHGEGAEWVIAHSKIKDEKARNAVLQLWESLPDG